MLWTFKIFLFLLALSHPPKLSAKTCKAVFLSPKTGVNLDSSSNITLDPEHKLIRTQLRDNQSLAFHPLVQAFQNSFEKLSTDLGPYYEGELDKTRFAAYFNIITARRSGERAGVPLSLSPFYIPGMIRGNYDEIVESGMYNYMGRSGIGSTYYKDLLKPFLHKATHYLFRYETKEETAFSFIPTPMGEHSPEFYRDLLLTTGIVLRALSDSSTELDPLFQELNSGDVSYARKELDIYSLGEQDGATRANPALFALQEGIISLHQLLTLLTSNKVKNTTGPELVEKVLSPLSDRGDTLASTFTRMIPMGLLGPQILRGDLFEKPLSVNNNGKIVPTSDFRNFLSEANNILADDINNDPYNMRGSCQGCPMVKSNEPDQASGIDILAKIYLNVFRYVQERTKSLN